MCSGSLALGPSPWTRREAAIRNGIALFWEPWLKEEANQTARAEKRVESNLDCGWTAAPQVYCVRDHPTSLVLVARCG